MYRYVMLAALSVASANLFAQDAAAIARQREAEERESRMTTMIERLQESNTVQQRRINELNNDIANLRRQLVEFENRYKNSQLGAVSQSDIRKVYDKMAEIEKNRQADNNLVKEQFVELKRILDKPAPPPVIVTPPTRDRGDRDDNKHRDEVTPLPAPQDFTGDYFSYKIKEGDRLLQVIGAYNDALKAEGNSKKITLDMVKKANPKMNPNNLKVGTEIKIPKP
jgi:DNA repair exonuclease SbcCD ATPase subunit